MSTKTRAKSPTKCIICGHKMRPFGTHLDDYPGTKRHGGKGKCQTCYSREYHTLVRKDKLAEDKASKYPMKCGGCSLMLRPKGAPAEDYDIPTVGHQGRGFCSGCYRRATIERDLNTIDLHNIRLLPNPGWELDGACNRDPELFYAPPGATEAIKKAKGICKTECPVQLYCLKRSLDNREPFGVWGGLDAAQRRAVLRNM